jgi:hypothetical protein
MHQWEIALEHAKEAQLMRAEIERLQTENWQLRQACGYPIPADKETINNPFKCGLCEARALFPNGDGSGAAK